MNVKKYIEHRDGTATIILDMSQIDADRLFQHGLSLLLKGKKVVVIGMEEARLLGIRDGKRYKISEKYFKDVMRFAVIDCLKSKIKQEKFKLKMKRMMGKK